MKRRIDGCVNVFYSWVDGLLASWLSGWLDVWRAEWVDGWEGEWVGEWLDSFTDPIYQPPSLGQDMTQGQFLSGV